MRLRPVLERGASLVGLIVHEFGRIPHYNAEGERLMRAIRNHGHDSQATGRIRIIRRVLNPNGRERIVALLL